MNRPLETRIGHSACPHDCPSTCALEVELLDERTIGRVHGAQGQRLHGRRRLRQGGALRRAGPSSRPAAPSPSAERGQGHADWRDPGAWQRIAWDEALDIVAENSSRPSRATAPRRCGPTTTPAPWAWCSATASTGCATPSAIRASSTRSAPIRPGPASPPAPASCRAPTRARWRKSDLRRHLGHQPGRHPGQRHDPCDPGAEGARRQASPWSMSTTTPP